MKKIFLLAGELSGDRLGAWYVKRLQEEKTAEFFGVGGDFLEKAGVKLYERFERLNVTGVFEIIKHLRSILTFLNDVVKHIIENNIDEVVVIDFPGFNLRLIKKLKERNPEIKITYLSPPQLWVWGERRIKKLKKYCDDVVVIYPFEVDWYKERGLAVRWLGFPFYGEFCGAKEICDSPGEDSPRRRNYSAHSIAILPGSRVSEIEKLLPLFLKVIHRFKLAHPNIKVFLPLAKSIDTKIVEKVMRGAGVGRWGHDIVIVRGEEEKKKVLRSCCLALSKPGSVTLELALLSIPAVVAYKTSWLTYCIARPLVKIEHMSLANLLSKDVVYPECIQSDCTEEKIFLELEKLYRSFLRGDEAHISLHEKFALLKKGLEG